MTAGALIFDFDGTLADTMPVHFLAWQRVARQHGLELSEERFYALGGMPTTRLIPLLAAEQGVAVDAEQVAHDKEQAFLELFDLVVPIEPVVEIARSHHGRVPLAVATGAVRDVLAVALGKLQLADLFEVIVTAEDTQRHKPEPDVFLETARRLQVSPELCHVYEDSDLGIQAAQRAGMPSTDVRTLYVPRRAASLG